jgi:hypothetical protein
LYEKPDRNAVRRTQKRVSGFVYHHLRGMEAIAEAAWVSAGSTALVRLIYFAMERGQVLYGLGRWLRRWTLHGGALRRRGGRWMRRQAPFYAPVLRALHKPLGGCIYCTAFWVTAFAAASLPWGAWFSALGFGYLWTALWLKLSPLE